ncbi:PREDICTED: ornithine decarboxylase-like [Ceratosolen solmsi marchali]|uniref:ornithine decarboxylase n=1 Tax=Ceratosolen solmsi marchali TaxID=326594 RepID=A0AAJ7E1D1_9HYME|nr:PREDICTED: ornithine decarboxylase-like [Ceratosolen solmsi marchali]
MALSLFPRNYDEVRVFDDKLDDLEFMKKLIDFENLDDPFHLLDGGDLIKKHRMWVDKIPRVAPHYAVKSNSSSTVIKTLASLGASFDCSSKQDIMHIMAYGVPANRIIFTNPVKTPLQIKYAKQVGISKLSADNMWELRKIKELYPEAKVLIRFRYDLSSSSSSHSSRAVINTDETIRLIRACRDLGLNLHGFSFHAYSPSSEMLALSRGIDACKYLIDVARTVGCHDIQLIDIGGGIPSSLDLNHDEVWSYFSRLQKFFVFKELLFEYKHLIFWFNDYYRTSWNYRKVSKFRRVTTTTYKRTSTLPW